MFCCGGFIKGSTYIKVDSLQDCIYFAISVMESGFENFPQCATLAYIPLVKRAFREIGDNLMHEF